MSSALPFLRCPARLKMAKRTHATDTHKSTEGNFVKDAKRLERCQRHIIRFELCRPPDSLFFQHLPSIFRFLRSCLAELVL